MIELHNANKGWQVTAFNEKIKITASTGVTKMQALGSRKFHRSRTLLAGLALCIQAQTAAALPVG